MPATGSALTSGFRPGLAKCDLLIRKVPFTWEDWACLESCPSQAEGTFQVNNSARAARVSVSADGRGLVSQAGAVLLWETMRVTGLAQGLADGLARWRAPAPPTICASYTGTAWGANDHRPVPSSQDLALPQDCGLIRT